ncbi:Transcriptional repressor tup12-related protein [Tritrichomonas foetus]|uniref:Transcriptional repressor tup12-related protein n=1 Tax=Tritrichomonas foetus TaxID=1144522 RepID=A0A1J4J8Q2_9EUKA|nr:Transcriptional repressor tup12-related protein [Tritrichomonas foetus]|eukprot:OHS93781.1 Transcriptional repressor tup12-related protein [Tritrichomonas foetus]
MSQNRSPAESQEEKCPTNRSQSQTSSPNQPSLHTDDTSHLCNDGEFLEDLYRQMKRTYSETDHLIASTEIPNPPHWVAKPSISPNSIYNTKSWTVNSENDFFNKSTVSQRYSMRADAILCALAFNHDGSNFAYAVSNNVFLMRSEDGSLIKAWDNPSSIEKSSLQTRVIQFSNNSHYLALGISNDKILLLTTDTDDSPVVLKGHKGQVSSLLFSHDDNYLISGGYDGYLCFWDLTQMSLLKVIKHRSDPMNEISGKSSVDGKIVSLAESNDRKFYAVGFMDGIVGIYESSFTKDIMKFIAHDKYLFGLAISNINNVLATASADGTVRLWDINAVAVCQRSMKQHKSIVMTACFSPIDANVLFTGSKDETVVAWDCKKGLPLFSVEFHENTVFQVAHHPTRRAFLSCSGDGMIGMWDYSLPEE